MQRLSLPVLLGIVLEMAGCVSSLNPLYTERDLLYDPSLVGVWAESDDAKETWAFEKAGEKGYKLVVTEQDGKTGEFKAHLLKLGNTLFLDLFPEADALSGTNRNFFYQDHWLPTHTFAKVFQVEPELKMAILDPTWLKEHLEKDPKAIAHTKVHEHKIVLTASTPELQKFVLKHANDAFNDPGTMRRRQTKR